MKKLAFVILIAGGCAGAAYYWQQTQARPTLLEKSITTTPLQFVTMRDVVSATGIVQPRETVVVSSEMPGIVVKLPGKINDRIREGEPIAYLDDRKIKLKLDEAQNAGVLAQAAVLQARALVTQAKGAKEAARAELKSQEDLAGAGGIRAELERTKAQLNAALAGVEAAEAGVAVAEARVTAAKTALDEAALALEMATIRVPGRTEPNIKAREFLVLDRKVVEGQMVGPQAQPLFTLAGDLQLMEIHAQVSEGDVNKIRQGLAALFTITNYNDEDVEFRGIVKEIRPLADSIKGAVYYDTVIEVANQKDEVSNEWRLRPGMTVSVDIIRRERSHVWRIPSQAMNFKFDDSYNDEAVKAKLAAWKQRPDHADWHVLWTWDSAVGHAVPMFVRIGGKKLGDSGLKDSEGNEVLEWEPGREPTAPNTPPRVIIVAPPARAPGLFDQPSGLKVS